MDNDKMDALRAELAAAVAEEAEIKAEARALRAKIKAAKAEMDAMEKHLLALAGHPWDRRNTGQAATAGRRIRAAEAAIDFESLPLAVMVRGAPCRVSRVTPKRIYLLPAPGGREVIVNRDSTTDHGWGVQIDIPATIAAWEAHVAAAGGGQ
jgi:hypothetical protein